MNRDFKGVWIPKEIWLDTRLNALDKIILVEINSLDGDEGCFASNEYLADFCQCSGAKVSKSISLLIELGYIKVLKFDGRKRFLKTCLIKNTSHIKNNTEPSKNYKADKEKIQDNNIYNNKDNNTISKDIEKTPKNYGNKDINLLFDEWEDKCLFPIKNKVQANRFACNRLIKSHGVENVMKVIPIVAESHSDKYAPSICNFMDLAEKWNNLGVWYKKKRIGENYNNGTIKL